MFEYPETLYIISDLEGGFVISEAAPDLVQDKPEEAARYVLAGTGLVHPAYYAEDPRQDETRGA